ncbi:DgyrCDS14890 [Dimorphilus gyrociliatus]|uniref:DgyrCDS14890 n=1 Tax=Dimorphilus gyrociliatus TaxID=2664684 RepID=A0A7I8WFD2_9ANNE|nr:DgyrCDS14890 [Dimorphilus gyrociliatus]
METNNGLWRNIQNLTNNSGYVCEMSKIDTTGCRPYWHVLKGYKDLRNSTKIDSSKEICLQDCFSGKYGVCHSISWDVQAKQCYLHSTKIFAEDFSSLVTDIMFNIYQWECEGDSEPVCFRENNIIDNLPDKSFTASTVATAAKSLPVQAKFSSYRQENQLGAFRPESIYPYQWLQVDLLNLYNVTGYHILGGERYDKNTVINHYVLYSLNCQDFSYYSTMHTKEIIMMIGHGFWSLTRVILFKYPIIARCFRILPITWDTTPDLRLSLRGCQLNKQILVSDLEGVALGMESGHIEDYQLSVKEMKASLTVHYPPFLARLRGRPKDYPFQIPCFYPIEKDNWFEVMWSLPIQFYGLSIDPSQASYGNIQVFTMAVASQIGVDMLEKVKDDNGNVLQFSLPNDLVTITPIQIRLDEPLTARYVRIYPVKWQSLGCSVFEFYGKLDAICPNLGLENNKICPIMQNISTVYNETSGLMYSRVESTILIELDQLYHLTSFQIKFARTPLPVWTLNWSRDNNIWKSLDKYKIDKQDDKTHNITFLNQHSATKLRINLWNLNTSLTIPCIEYSINGCEAETCPPNTIEYDHSCYHYFPGEIYGASDFDTGPIRHICDNIVWKNQAYTVEVSSIEEDSLVVYLNRRTGFRVFYGLVVNNSIPQTPHMKLLNPDLNWQWSNNAEHNFTNFDRNNDVGEPGLPTEHCVMYSTKFYAWHNINCNAPCQYLCEMKANKKRQSTQSTKWFYYQNSSLNSNHLHKVYETTQVESCSYLCQQQKEFQCKRFAFGHDSQKCFLYNETTNYDINSIPVDGVSSLDTWEIYSTVNECEQPLIESPNGISDSNIQTNSPPMSSRYGISQLRMVYRQFYGSRHPDNAGYFKGSDQTTYLKFDFGRIVRMTRIKIEGAGSYSQKWIEYFYLAISNRTDSLNFVKTSNGDRRKFFGNFNQLAIIQNAFRPHLIAQYVQFFAYSYHREYAVRLEFYGCNYTGIVDEFTKPLGLKSNYILHSQMLAEQLYTAHTGIHEIRLGCLPVFHSTGYFHVIGKWQFDLGIQHFIVKTISTGNCNGRIGYLKTFSIMYTNDLEQWSYHVTNNGSVKNYYVSESNEKAEVTFDPIIKARYIRFIHTDQSNSIIPAITMELYGYPAKHSKLGVTGKFPKTITVSSQKSLSTSGKMALMFDNSFWCKEDNDTDGWWLADMNTIHYIERIYIYHKENQFKDSCKDISVSGAQFDKKNITKMADEITCKSELNRTIIFSSPALRLRYILLNFTNGPKDCVRFELYGEKAPICPPGSLRQLDKCYTISDAPANFEQCDKFCKTGFNWKDQGYLVMPKNSFEVDLVQRYYMFKDKNYGIYIGAKQTTLTSYDWLDGTPITNYLQKSFHFSANIFKTYLIRKDTFENSEGTENGYAMCETMANLPDDENDYDEEENCQPLYSLLPHHTLNSTPIASLDITKSYKLLPEGNFESEKDFNVTTRVYKQSDSDYTDFRLGKSMTSYIVATCSDEYVYECYLEVNFERLVTLTAFTTAYRLFHDQYTRTAQIFYKRSSYDQWLAVRDKDGDIISYFIQEDQGYYNHIEFSSYIVCKGFRFNPIDQRLKAILSLQLYGRYLEDDDIPIYTPKCNHPLGIGDKNQIHISQITTPSYLKPYYANNVRLDSLNCWIPESLQPNDYIQIDLGHVYHVTGFISQSCKSEKKYIYEFNVKYSLYRIHGWKTYNEESLNNKTLFIRSSPILTTNMKYLLLFNETIDLRFMRLSPKGWYNNKGLRLEIIGCIKQEAAITTAKNELQQITVQEDTLGGNSIYWGELINPNLTCLKQPIKIGLNCKSVYKITGFTIYSNLTENLNLTIEYSLDSLKWITYSNGYDYNYSNNTKKHQILLSIPIIAIYVTLSVQTDSLICWKISIHGGKYSECPPGYFLFGTKCISHHSSTTATHFSSANECKGLPWKGEGYMLLPNESTETRMGLMLHNGKFTWSDGSTLPENEVIRWNGPIGFDTCGAFDKSNGFWQKISCFTDSLLFSCEKDALPPPSEKKNKFWTVVPSASLNTSNANSWIYKSDFNTKFDCLMACNEEIRFDCISFSFDTKTKECECSISLIKENVLGVKWNVSSEYDSSTDKTHLPLHEKKGLKGYWRPKDTDTKPWILFYFDQILSISSFILQGSGKLSDFAYVKKFTIQSSIDNIEWSNVTWDYSNTYDFEGSFDHVYSRLYTFKNSLRTRYVKFDLIEKRNSFSMQIELFGCVEFIPDCFTVPSTNDLHIEGTDKKSKLKCFEDWTVIGQKLSADNDYWLKNWYDYKHGFESDKEFWSGNELATYLTNFRQYNARIDMWSKDGSHVHSEFEGIKFQSERNSYSKTIEKFQSGSAPSTKFLTTTYFYSIDNDNELSCAQNTKSGWWFSKSSCSSSNLVGSNSYWFLDATDLNDVYKFKVEKFLFKIKPKTPYNIALGKKAYQKVTNGKNEANLAIDGIALSDASLGYCAIGELTTNPWWVVDLLKSFNVTGITVLNRKDCCSSELSNFTIGLADSFDESNFNPTLFKLCKYYNRTIGSGVKVAINCENESTQGSYLAIWMEGENRRLGLCEVEIKAKLKYGESSFGEDCETDSNCVEELTSCLPRFEPKNLDILSYSCQCSLYTIRKDNKCYAATDILLKNINFQGEFIREEESTQQSTVLLVNNGGWTIAESTLPNNNFEFSALISNLESNFTETWRQDLILTFIYGLNAELPSRNLTNLTKRGEASISLSASLKFPILQCYNQTYVCGNVLRSPNSSFIEWDSSNNEKCFSFLPFINCKPEIDLSIFKITLMWKEYIYRSITQNHTFVVTLLNNNSNVHDVIPLFDEYFNFDMEYVLSDKIEDINSSNPKWKKATMDLKDKQKGLKIGTNLNLTINLSAYISRSQCENDLNICFRIVLSNSSSYKESNRNNDILCLNLEKYKNCTPGLAIKGLNFQITNDNLMEGSQSEFSVLWKEGTDVNYIVNFTNIDSTYWNWLESGHVSSFGQISKQTLQYNYTNYGRYNVSLTAWNEVGIEIFWLIKIVEPILENHIEILNEYIPNEPPVQVIFNVYYKYDTNKKTKQISLSCIVEMDQNFTTYKTGTLSHNLPVFIDFIYPIDKLQTTAIVVCNNTVSSFNSTYILKLQQNVSDLIMKFNATYWPSFKNISLELTLKNGSDVEYEISFGDGIIKVFKHPELFANRRPFLTYYSYSLIGEYKAKAIVRNEFFNCSSETTQNLFIQHEIKKIDLRLSYKQPRTVNLTITEVENGFSPTNVTCLIQYSNRGNERILYNVDLINGVFLIYEYSREFNEREKRNLTIKAVCYNNVSSSSAQQNLLLEEEISHLNASIDKTTVKTFEQFSINLTAITGTNINWTIDFGDDGTSLNKFNDGPGMEYNLNYTYKTPGLFQIVIKMFNSVNNITRHYSIIVQVPIIDFIVDTPKTGTIDNQPINFNVKVNQQGQQQSPTDVFCSFQPVLKQNATIEYVYKPEMTNKKQMTLSYNYSKMDVGRNITVGISCKNLVSKFEYYSNLSIFEKIQNLTVNIEKYGYEKYENISLILNVDAGSSIIYKINQSATILVEKHPMIFANQQPFVKVLQFSNIGNHSLRIVGENDVSQQEQIIGVVVQNRIENIDLMANESILWTPGVISYQLYSESTQQILTDVYCQFEFSNGMSANKFIPIWPPSGLFTYNFYFPKTAIGNLTTNLSCSNLLSVKKLQTRTEIILDAVIIEQIRDNGTVLLTNETTIIIEISRMGTNSCFILDLGDTYSTKLAFGVNELCENFAFERSINFTKIGYEEKTIVINHVYEAVAYYSIKVEGFNNITKDEKSFITRVADWHCYSPNATVPIEYTIADNPLQIIKSIAVEIPVNISWDCMKTNQLQYEWKIIELSTNSLVFQSNNKTLKVGERQLDYGQYKIEYFIQMFNISYANNTYEYFIEIIPSQLHAEIENGKWISVNYGINQTFNAGLYSYDPDNQENDKLKGLHFHWYCRQQNEVIPFNFNSYIQTGLNLLKIPTLSEFKKNGGCFGNGPGYIGNSKTGKLTLKTYYMIPNITYIITVKIQSNIQNRQAIYEQNLYLKPFEKPILNIRCKKNCLRKKALSSSIIYKAVCLSKCTSLYWKISYFWKSFVYANQTLSFVQDFQDRVLNGNLSLVSIEIKENGLFPGHYHTVSVEGQMGEIGDIGYTNETFLVNKPPFGGHCSCQPRYGFASITNFRISCLGYKEFEKSPDAPGLKYEYRVRWKGRRQSFPLYFSYNQEAVYLMLPVGDPKYGITETVVRVIDSIDDKYEFIFDVHVQPPPKPERLLLESTLNDINNGNLEILLDVGNFSQLASSIYSVASILNTNLSKPPKELERDKCEKRTTRIGIRKQLIEYVLKTPHESVDELEQNNGLISSLVFKPKEVDINSQVNVANQVGKLNTVLNTKKITPKLRREISISLLETSILVTTAADTFKQDVEKKEEFIASNKNNNSTIFFCDITSRDNGTNLPNNNTIDYIVNSTNNKLRIVMTNILNAIHNVTNELLLRQKLNDPPLIVEYEEMAISIERLSINRVINNNYSSKFGSVNLNSFKIDNNSDSCVTKMLIMSRINPYMWDKSSLNVTSSVTELQIKPCNSNSEQSARRKKRSVENIQTNFTLNLHMLSDNTAFQHINTTNTTALHIINATRSVLLLTFKLKRDDSISVLIGYNFIPVSDRNNASFILPNANKTCSSNMNLEDCIQYKRTIMLRINENQTVITSISCSNCSNGNLNYSIHIAYPTCKMWKGNSWEESDACRIDKETTASKTKFTSNLFGSLGAGLEMAPNLIDFRTVFNDFSTKLANNAAVFGTICSLLILFILLALPVRRMDKRDTLLWTPLPLLDNCKEDQYVYEVHVYTGSRKDCGTKSKVCLTCYGSDCNTGNRILSSSKEETSNFFREGSTRSFIMKTTQSLGSIICIKISLEKDNPNNADNPDDLSLKEYDPWFLSRIIIIDKSANAWYNFDCDEWLSPKHGDRQTERILIGARSDANTKIDGLFKKNLRQRLTDDHLWVSIGARRTKSQFTRLQRLTVCFVALFLSMIASCMFYRNSDESSVQNGLKIGVITFTVYELYVGLASSIVVFPGLILITLLFNSKRWPKYTIPLGWSFAVLTAFTAAFFTVLYSIQWGEEKSLQWLISFILSFVQSIILVQPIKVICIVFLLTFFLKKDAILTEYEDDIGDMRKMDMKDLSHVPAELNIFERLKMAADKENKSKMENHLDGKMRIMIKDIVLHTIFLIFIIFICYSNHNPMIYYQNRSIYNTIPNVQNVKNYEKLWDWLENYAIPELYPKTHYNKRNLSSYNLKYTRELNHMRFSSVRLFQRRVQQSNCILTTEMKSLFKNRSCCGFDDSTLDYSSSLNSTLRNAFTYSIKEKGFSVSLRQNGDEALQIITNLKKYGWLDRQTRHVILDVTILNQVIVSQASWSFEFKPVGGIIAKVRSDSLKLYRYTGAGGLATLIFEILSVLVWLIFIIRCIYRYKKYFEMPGVLLLISLVSFTISIVLYIWRTIIGVKSVEEVMNSRTEYVDLSLIFSTHQYFMTFIAFCGFFGQLHVLSLLKLSKTITVLVSTIKKSCKQLISIGLCCCIIFIAYACWGYVIFGKSINNYKSFKYVCYSLLVTIFGHLDFEALSTTSGLMGKIYITSYASIMLYLILNIFITTLNEFLYSVRLDPTALPEDHKVFKYMTATIAKMFSKNNTKPEENLNPERNDKCNNSKFKELNTKIDYMEKIIFLNSDKDIEIYEKVLNVLKLKTF